LVLFTNYRDREFQTDRKSDSFFIPRTSNKNFQDTELEAKGCTSRHSVLHHKQYHHLKEFAILSEREACESFYGLFVNTGKALIPADLQMEYIYQRAFKVNVFKQN